MQSVFTSALPVAFFNIFMIKYDLFKKFGVELTFKLKTLLVKTTMNAFEILIVNVIVLGFVRVFSYTWGFRKPHLFSSCTNSNLINHYYFH